MDAKPEIVWPFALKDLTLAPEHFFSSVVSGLIACSGGESF